MLPNNNQLHMSDLKFENQSKNTTTTNTPNSKQPPVPVTPNNNVFNYSPKQQQPPSTPKNVYGYNGGSAVKSTPGGGNTATMILEELIVDNEDNEDNDGHGYYNPNETSEMGDSPLTPSKRSKFKTGKKYRLMEATCSCPIHDQPETTASHLCPRCHLDTTHNGNTKYSNIHNQTFNSQRHNLGSGYSVVYTNGVGNTGKLNFEKSTVNPQESVFRKSQYNVVSTGVPYQDFHLLSNEVDSLNYTYSNSLYNSGLKPPIIVQKVPFSKSSGPYTSHMGSRVETDSNEFSKSFHPSNSIPNKLFQQQQQQQQQQYHFNIPQPTPIIKNIPKQPQPYHPSQQQQSTNMASEQLIEDLKELLRKKDIEIHEKNIHYSEQLEQMGNRIVEYETLDGLQKEIDAIRIKIEMKLKELNSKDNIIYEKEGDIERVRMNEYNSNQERAQDLLNEVCALRLDISQFEKGSSNNSQQLIREINQLKSEVDSKKREIYQLTSDKDSNIRKYKDFLDQKDRNLEHYKNVIHQLSIEKADLQKEVFSLKNSQSILMEQLKDYNILVDNLEICNQHIQDLEKENHDMKERLSKVHFIIQDTPRRSLTTEEILALTPKKLQPQNKIPNEPQLPLNSLSDLKIIKPSPQQEQQQYQSLLQHSPYIPKNITSQPIEKSPPVSISYEDSSQEEQEQEQEQEGEEEEVDEKIDISYDDSSEDNEEPININDDSYDNHGSDSKFRVDEIIMGIPKSNGNYSTPSLFSTPSSVDVNSITPISSKTKETLKKSQENDDDDDGGSQWFSQSDSKKNIFNSTKSPTASKPNDDFRIQLLLDPLSSEEAKNNVLPQDCLLSTEFISISNLETSLYNYINGNKKLKSQLPPNFSRMGKFYKFGKNKISISTNNNIIGVASKNIFEPLDTFVERYQDIK